MEDLQTMSPEVANGQEATPASPQAAQTPEQSGSESQEASAVQVENGANPTSTNTQGNASEFETARHLKRMMREIQSLKQAIERGATQSQPQSVPQTQTPRQFTNDELVKNPLEVINQMIAAQVQGIKGEI